MSASLRYRPSAHDSMTRRDLLAGTILLIGGPSCATAQSDQQLSGRRKLEERQERAFRALGVNPRIYTQGDLDAYVIELKQAQARIAAEVPGSNSQTIAASHAKVERNLASLRARGLLTLPTRYENPKTYLDMALVLNELEDGMVRVFQRPLAPRPIFGSLPRAAIQASVEPIDGEYLVTFEAGLLTYASQACQVIARAIPGHEVGDKLFAFELDRTAIVRHLEHNDDIVQSFANLLLAYLVHGATFPLSNSVANQTLPKAGDVLASDLYRSMLLFALAHEYGHIIAIDEKLGEPPGLGPAWGREIAADRWGVFLSLIASTNLQGLPYVLWGIRLLLNCYEILERGVMTLDRRIDREQLAGDHPPTEMRLKYLVQDVRFIAQKTVGLGSEDDLRQAFESSAQFDAVTEVLWALAQPTIAMADRRGARLAPMWPQIR
jgi:hypothetical protein